MPEMISHYKVLKTLGQGGMGVVYLCRDERLKRDVAVKVLSDKYSQDPIYRQRFLTEAQSASALNHPNIITIYEIGTDQGRDFIAMEYVVGQSLDSILSARGALPVRELLDIGIQLAKGLAAAHPAGIVHRDLKPGNVIITPDGRVKILDFGLARQQESRGAAPADTADEAATIAASYTQPGMILGTPGFMSPEQARGGLADHRSDQFSLGCILHAMASGKAPFLGESIVDVLHGVLHKEPEPLDGARSDLPFGFIEVLQRCLQKRPEDRYPGAAAVEFALSNVKEALSSPSQVQTVPGVPSSRWHPRRKWALPLGIAGALAAVLIILFAFGLLSRAKTMTVSVQDEEGHQIRREVPTAENRKRIGIFPFEVDHSDSTDVWLSFAVSDLLCWDLMQDYYLHIDPLIDLLGSSKYAEEAKKAGYPKVLGTPLHLKRQVAKASSCSHFVAGRVGAAADSFWMDVELYNIKSGRLQTDFHLAGTDFFALMDQMSLRLRRDLGVPESHLQEWPDLPLVAIATNSMTALEWISRATMTRDIDGDLDRAAEYLEKAVEADPACALAYWSLFYIYQYSNQGTPARTAGVINSLMTHISRIPEGLQFAVKAVYFQNQNEIDKMMAVIQMWRDLYPYDIRPLEILINLHRARGETDQVIATMQKLLELEPDSPQYLLQTGEELQRTGKYESARGYFEKYVERHPDDSKALLALGELLQALGEHAEAKRTIERAQIMTPQDPDIRAALAKCEYDLGNLTAWPTIVQSILTEPLSPDERLSATMELADYYELRGQNNKAAGICIEGLDAVGTSASTLWILLTQIDLARQLAKAGRREQSIEWLDKMKANAPLPYRTLVLLGPLEVYPELGDLTSAEAAADELETIIKAMNLELLRFKWMEAMGRIREKQGNFDEASDFFRRRIEISPAGVAPYRDLGRCYRKMGKFKEAGAALEVALKRAPYHPLTLLEMALTNEAMGRRVPALENLNRVLEIWADADSSFAPAQEARELKRGWSETS
ncbi:MAG: protein kinase [Candidatus Eisenbacteria bacterium]|uniref:Protein kinase n=1 Tax=Eiseniibacteriota bacterium TaxID=2212470 RepID=A0A948RXW1_UNCEI|nr:protein kinase [Candidatus Eisenbacteria bacterium]